MKAREWVTAFLVPRVELVRELDKAKRNEARARQALHFRQAIEPSLHASVKDRRERIRALEVENARLKDQLNHAQEIARDLSHDLTWAYADLDYVVLTGELPNRGIGRAS